MSHFTTLHNPTKKVEAQNLVFTLETLLMNTPCDVADLAWAVLMHKEAQCPQKTQVPPISDGEFELFVSLDIS